jgi:hypothetical protein
MGPQSATHLLLQLSRILELLGLGILAWAWAWACCWRWRWWLSSPLGAMTGMAGVPGVSGVLTGVTRVLTWLPTVVTCPRWHAVPRHTPVRLPGLPPALTRHIRTATTGNIANTVIHPAPYRKTKGTGENPTTVSALSFQTP